MNKKSMLLIFVAVFSIFIMIGCNNEPGDAKSGENVTIRISHVLQEDNPSHVSMIEVFKPEVEKNSDGRIKVEIYPNAQLGSDRQAIEAVSLGSLEMTMPAGAALSGFTEEFMIFDLPFLYKDRQSAYDAWDGELGAKVNESLKSQNIMNLGYGENGLRHITNNKKPIYTPDDLDGIKIRVMENPIHLETFKSLGSNPTPIAFGELFTALQQGTVDAQENPLAIINSSKFYEVQKYLTLTGHVFGNAPYLINKDFYEGLSQEDQDIVAAAIKNTEQYQRELLKEQEAKNLKSLEDQGMIINEITEEQRQLFIDQSQPSYDMFIKKFGDDLIKTAQQYNK